MTQPGTIQGAIEYTTFEQRVLGAWPSFLNQSPEIAPDPKESRFFITPLPPGSTCETVKKSQDGSKTEDIAR